MARISASKHQHYSTHQRACIALHTMQSSRPAAYLVNTRGDTTCLPISYLHTSQPHTSHLPTPHLLLHTPYSILRTPYSYSLLPTVCGRASLHSPCSLDPTLNYHLAAFTPSSPIAMRSPLAPLPPSHARIQPPSTFTTLLLHHLALDSRLHKPPFYYSLPTWLQLGELSHRIDDKCARLCHSSSNAVAMQPLIAVVRPTLSHQLMQHPSLCATASKSVGGGSSGLVRDW